MKKSISIVAMALGCAAMFSTGCTTSSSGNVFSRNEALYASVVVEGTVLEVRAGKIEGEQSGIGAAAGAVGGAAVGNLFGGGKGNTIATIGGAIVGGLAGNAAEKGMTSSQAYQITVKLDDGRTIVVVQETDIQFAPQQRVRAVVTGDKWRIQPL